MISDTLHDALFEIGEYLELGAYKCEPEILTEINTVVENMRALMQRLDAYPTQPQSGQDKD